MKKLLAIFLLVCASIFAEKYIPKNKEEIQILEKYKNQKIVLSGIDAIFSTSKIVDNKSLNMLLEEMLKDYIGLNVEVKELTLKDSLKEARDGKIDGILTLEKTRKRGGEFCFSNILYYESIYIISFDEKIVDLNSLRNQEIKMVKNTLQREILESISNNNDLNLKIKEIDRIKNNRYGLVLTSYPDVYRPTSYIKISQSTTVAMALNKKYEDLLPIINNALKEKYAPIIQKYMKSMKEAYRKENFRNTLTLEEKKYLENIKKLDIYVENNENLLYYCIDDKEYEGTIANIVSELEKQLELDINLKIVKNIKDVKDRKSTDVFVFSKNKDLAKQYIFSKKIFDLNVYVILENQIDSIKNGKIGVLSNSLEEYVVNKYEIKDNIIKYNSIKKMKDGLKNRKIDRIMTSELASFPSQDYIIDIFEKIPINFAVNKNNIILRDILNKALDYGLDIKEIKEFSNVRRRKHNQSLILSDQKLKQRLIYLAEIISGILIILIVSYRYKSNASKKLLKDPLTGLNNRAVFNKFCKEDGKDFEGYVFVADFNNFKIVNDRYGHEYGDKVLVDFGNFLKLIFDEKYIFRISGDEFYGVFKENLKDTLDLIERYEEYCPVLKKYNVSFNIGIYEKKSNESLEEAFKYADLAMLENKEKKEFSYKIVDKAFIKRKDREATIVKLLDGDLEELYVVFQPKVYVGNRKLMGVEALSRWDSKELGQIYPKEFIEIAERYNKVHKIDYKVLEIICKNLNIWQKNEELKNEFKVSFNLSYKTFLRHDLIEKIVEILKKYNIDGKYLEVEITEKIFMTGSMKDIDKKLKKLIDLGIDISLDDFTAGHSIAGSLPLLPIKVVKFDKVLLDSIKENDSKGKIVYKELVSLIKELELQIVAEGVERKEDLKFLEEIGVDCIQGYLIGRPEIYKKSKNI